MGQVTDIELEALMRHARKALSNAYAPYSNFPVGAAVLDDRGNIYAGVNVENVSYGLTNCAERTAIFTAVAAGAKRILAVAVASSRVWPITPCGACRQVILEFSDSDTPVISDQQDGKLVKACAADLLPGAFSDLG